MIEFAPSQKFTCDGPTVKVMLLSDTRAKQINQYGTADDHDMSAAGIKAWEEEEASLKEFEIQESKEFKWNYNHRFPHWAEILPDGKIKILNP